MINIQLPFPPSNNQYYRRTPNGMTISKRGKAYKADIIQLLDKFGLAGMNIDYPVTVRLELYPPCNRTRDTDNYQKGLYDAFTNAKLWIDDSIVKESTVRMMEPVKGGYINVEIYPDMQAGFY